MKLETVLDQLRKRCEEVGGQARFAREIGVTKGMISHVLLKRHPPGPKILEALGLEKTVTYQVLDPSQSPLVS